MWSIGLKLILHYKKVLSRKHCSSHSSLILFPKKTWTLTNAELDACRHSNVSILLSLRGCFVGKGVLDTYLFGGSFAGVIELRVTGIDRIIFWLGLISNCYEFTNIPLIWFWLVVSRFREWMNSKSSFSCYIQLFGMLQRIREYISALLHNSKALLVSYV